MLVRYLCGYLPMIVAQLFAFCFWGALIVGYFYYGFFGEGTTCYATQDKDKTVPWDYEASPDDVPDSYHHVNANFKVVCILGFF